ncbi:MAG: ferritin-like domain-containing protein [Gemmatimonadaceae bacterium]
MITVEMETLRDLYIEELKDLYSAESQILKALPKMIKKATNRELKKAFTDHERVTKEHARRLERICRELGERASGKKCKGMEGVIGDGKELMEEDAEPEVMDAGLISAAQHVEHYEIAGYGTVRTYARELGYDDQANLLQRTLDEEKDADMLLTRLAEGSINLQAEHPSGSESSNGRKAARGGGGARKGSAKRAHARSSR